MGWLEAVVALVGVFLAFLGGMALNRAKAIRELNDLVNRLVNDRADDREKIDNLEEAFGNYKDEVRNYFQQLMDYFEKKGLTDYPKPPKKIFDTHDRMKAVK